MSEITYADLSSAGIDIDRVTNAPNGIWTLVREDDARISWGESTTETGEQADGWDWTSYAGVGSTASDWESSDAAMIEVIRKFAAA